MVTSGMMPDIVILFARDSPSGCRDCQYGISTNMLSANNHDGPRPTIIKRQEIDGVIDSAVLSE